MGGVHYQNAENESSLSYLKLKPLRIEGKGEGCTKTQRNLEENDRKNRWEKDKTWHEIAHIEQI